MSNNAALVPEDIPNVAIKAAIGCEPQFFVNLYNQCLLEGNFTQ